MANTSLYDMKSVKSEEFGGRAQRDKTPCYIQKRCILIALCCIATFNLYATRVNLSVTMVAMVNNTRVRYDEANNMTRYNVINNTYLECSNLFSPSDISEAEKYAGEQYNWNTKEQGLILSAFYYGYIFTQVPGGYLSEKYGAKWLFGGGVMATSVLTLLSPAAAGWGVIPFCTVRLFGGIFQGVTVPSMNTMISRWSPKLERSRLSTICFSGGFLGTVMSMSISGWLSSLEILGGWPSAFHVFGIFSCIWFLFWIFLVSEFPDMHPSISKDELKRYETNDEVPSKKNIRTPWKAIFTSLPVWALTVAHFGYELGFLLFLTELPSYFSSILHFNITKNGMLSALPHILQAAVALIASYLADRIRKSNIMTITNIRKTFNSIGLLGPAICLFGVTISGCQPQLIVALLCLAMALSGFVYSGFNVTHVDMSPAFAGTMYAITNTIATVSGLIGPVIVGALTDGEVTVARWNAVFYITAATYTVGAIIFALFGSAELQPWGEGEDISLKLSSTKSDNDVSDIANKS